MINPLLLVSEKTAYYRLCRRPGPLTILYRMPKGFQRKCEKNVTAYYEVRDDGRIDVTNRCIGTDGDTNEVVGIAKIADTLSNAKLKVSFVSILGINLFWGDYWVIGLADDYRYAIVGHPNHKYGWILRGLQPRRFSDDHAGLKELTMKGVRYE